MGDKLTSHWLSVRWRWFIAIASLLAASATLALPSSPGNSAEYASVIAIAALATLAGHSWGILVLAIADAILVGRMAPYLAFEGAHTTWELAAADLAVAGGLPGLLLLHKTIPQTLRLFITSPLERIPNRRTFAAVVILMGIVFGSAAMFS